MGKNKPKHSGERQAPVRVNQAAPPPARKPARAGWVRMKLTAELLEDAHPGAGTGGLGIDALVARDRDGEPVIWATHVEGLMRDVVQRFSGKKEACQQFGEVGGHRQQTIFTSLYAVRDTGKKREARVWRSAARTSEDNRAPMDDTLRAIEYVPKGTRFEGHIEIQAGEVENFENLLCDIDAIGHGRAAGAGRVKLRLSPAPVIPRAVDGTATQRLILAIRNLDPISITATATPENIIPTLPFIPGRTLLGALAGWLSREGHRNSAELLTNGAVAVRDALPLAPGIDFESVTDVLPAPLSLKSEKPPGSPGLAPWWADAQTEPRRVDSHKLEHGDDSPKLKRPEPDLFVYRRRGDSKWVAYKPTIHVRLRNRGPIQRNRSPHYLQSIRSVSAQRFLPS